jgi:acylphosphatase
MRFAPGRAKHKGGDMEKKVRAHVIVSGRVQGVFFRMETKRAADRLGVSGWVRNLNDGTVEAVFEGSRDLVQAGLDWCRQGPPHAAVDDVQVTWQEYAGEFDGFQIVYPGDF